MKPNAPPPTTATRKAAANCRDWTLEAIEAHPTDVCAIRIALISDQRVLFDSLAIRLEMQRELKVVSAADGGNAASKRIQRAEAEVAVLDADLDGERCLEIASDLRLHSRSTKLIFLASSVSDPWIVQALRLNASGILLKSETVVRAIKLVAEGKTNFSSEVHQRLTYDDRRGKHTICHRTVINELTNRQLEILRQIAHGDTVKEVARKTNLTLKSVDSHKYRIMRKVGVRDRVHLARLAIREGLIRP